MLTASNISIREKDRTEQAAADLTEASIVRVDKKVK